MATPKLLLSKLIRRSRPTLSISSPFLSTHHESSSNSLLSLQSASLTTPNHILHLPPSTATNLLASFNFLYSRSLSTRSSSTPDSGYGGDLNPDGSDSAALPEELYDRGLGFSLGDGGGGGDGDGLELAEPVISSVTAAGSDVESILPVHGLISLLDSYHDLTGFHWWVIIASSTLALRVTLLPVLILQLHKIKKIAKLFPKLPPPLPPPLSGRSYSNQLLLFYKERRAMGCPSYLWFLAYVSVQVPCFILWMTSIRRMSLDHHPGFDSGGILWFQNLTEYSHGVLGPIFPFMIAGLHLINVQISFRTSSVGKVTGLLGLLAKYYRFYLNLLTLPIFITGFCVPQGSLVYWLTNSSLSLFQLVLLSNPNVRENLGLPEKNAPLATAIPKEMDTPGIPQIHLLIKGQKILAQHMSPLELLAFSIKLLSEGHRDRAMPLLRLALDKDPDYVRALVVMGQTLLQNGQLAEAQEYLERAISKLFFIGYPSEVEEIDLLILASQWAGVAFIRQEKMEEGIRHLERVARLNEPEDPKSKAHYYDSFILLASALCNEGRKAEAARYLHKAVAYNPDYKVYLEQLEEEDNFVGDLASSRRGDNLNS